MILRHLLPRAKAWSITADKQLRQFLLSFDILETEAKEFFDGVFLDLLPGTTRELDAWEAQFALPDLGQSDSDRRDRLAATWQALGGQDPEYIEAALQAAGFDVYLHEWWEPGTESPVGTKAAATPRNPLAYLRQGYSGIVPMVDAGEALAQAGEAFAEAGNRTDPGGYPLVNKLSPTLTESYAIPVDPALWPYFLYIGGEVFGTLANVDPKRRNEFEALCLKICPTQLWLGILVEYVAEV